MNRMRTLLSFMVAVGVAIVTMAGCGAKPDGQAGDNGEPYYAFTLSNGSLLFAQLKSQDKLYLYLSHIHYLQRTPPSNPPKRGEPETPNLQLVRQSMDLHGPQDELILNRAQLLFYQELREDSRVVQAIRRQAQATPQMVPPAVAPGMGVPQIPMAPPPRR